MVVQGEGAAGRRSSRYLRADLTLVHLPPPRRLPRRSPRRCSPPARPAIAYETVQLADGALPLLAPMSEVAGPHGAADRAPTSSSATTAAAACCSAARPACGPARVVVLGAGNVGWNAAWIAAGMEAEVLLLDKNLDRLRWVDQIHKGRIMTLASQPRRGRARGGRRRPRDRRGARRRRPGAGRRHRGRWCAR